MKTEKMTYESERKSKQTKKEINNSDTTVSWKSDSFKRETLNVPINALSAFVGSRL
jgi:hypothetical protein